MSGTLRLAVVPGDGIGPEVVREALRALDALGLDARVTVFPWGAEHFLTTGETLPDGTFERLARDFDAVLAGAFGDPRVPDGRHADEILLGMRRHLDLYLNVRPVKALHDSVVPLKRARAADVDFVIVRENTEGAYSGRGRVSEAGTPREEAVEEDVTTWRAVTRVCRAAFLFAEAFEKPRRLGRAPRVVMADKHNVQKRGGGLWLRAFREMAAEFPGCEARHMFADALGHEMLRDPASLDVVVTSNLFGDLLSDVGAALQGGLGLAPSGNVRPGHTSVFEPVHGSAPGLAGTGTANPFGAIRSLGMLLGHVGHVERASRIEEAVAACLAAGETTRDLGGTLSTEEAGRAAAARLRRREGVLSSV